MRPLRSAFLALILSTAPVTALAADVSGTWEYRGPAGSGRWLKTLQVGKQVRFQLELARGAPSHNSGSLEGEFELRESSGLYESNENGPCAIEFVFTRASVQLREVDGKHECGFGYGVSASGPLKLKSRKKPSFDAGDQRSGGR